MNPAKSLGIQTLRLRPRIYSFSYIDYAKNFISQKYKQKRKVVKAKLKTGLDDFIYSRSKMCLLRSSL